MGALSFFPWINGTEYQLSDSWLCHWRLSSEGQCRLGKPELLPVVQQSDWRREPCVCFYNGWLWIIRYWHNGLMHHICFTVMISKFLLFVVSVLWHSPKWFTAMHSFGWNWEASCENDILSFCMWCQLWQRL